MAHCMTHATHTLLEPSGAPVPLILSSPHSGRNYPDDFGYICPLPLLRQAEDAYVDELIAGATSVGVAIVQAQFPRSYIDVNRGEDDLDPALLSEAWQGPLAPSERTLRGLGLVRRLCQSGVPMYAAPLAVATVQQRILRCYRPYHAALEALIRQRSEQFGAVWMIDCHSMPSRRLDGSLLPVDFVLGDRDATSCDPAFTRYVRDVLQDYGYSVAINNPFKGVEILRRHGQPQRGRHALQLEISRSLYMDELTLEKHEGFARVQDVLARLFALLAIKRG